MDLKLFKETVIPLQEKLQIRARGLLISAADAEDAVQETFLKLWNNRHSLQVHPVFRACLNFSKKSI